MSQNDFDTWAESVEAYNEFVSDVLSFGGRNATRLLGEGLAFVIGLNMQSLTITRPGVSLVITAPTTSEDFDSIDSESPVYIFMTLCDENGQSYSANSCWPMDVLVRLLKASRSMSFEPCECFTVSDTPGNN